MDNNLIYENIDNDKLQIIIAYIIKQKLKLEYKKDEYQRKNFWLLLSNMIFNTANTLLISFTNYDNNTNNILAIQYITFIFAFICAIFSYLMKILNYEKFINTYKQYLNECNEVIYEYTNLITIKKKNEEKNIMIKNILNGYEKILKFNSEVDTIRLSDIDELTYNDMTSDFNDLLKINYKNVNKFIKKRKITIHSNTPSNNSDDNNNNNKVIIDILSTLTKNNTLINIPNNTHETINIKNEKKIKTDLLSSITKNTLINYNTKNNNSLYDTINNNNILDNNINNISNINIEKLNETFDNNYDMINNDKNETINNEKNETINNNRDLETLNNSDIKNNINMIKYVYNKKNKK